MMRRNDYRDRMDAQIACECAGNVDDCRGLDDPEIEHEINMLRSAKAKTAPRKCCNDCDAMRAINQTAVEDAGTNRKVDANAAATATDAADERNDANDVYDYQ